MHRHTIAHHHCSVFTPSPKASRVANKIISLSALASALLSIVTLTGCGKTSPSIKIGLNTELTGEMPAVGASSKNAADLFVSQLNAAGGVKVGDQTLPLQISLGDNGAKADQAAAVTQRLISPEGVVAMIGPNASVEARPSVNGH